MPLKVTVIGPGAMGCLFATKLAKSGIQTTVADYKEDRIRRLAHSGITIDRGDGVETFRLPVVATVPNGQDLVIVFVKSYNTRDLRLLRGVQTLTLQNGLGNAETISSMVGSSVVLAGITYEAATLLREGYVRHAATGLTTFGAWTSCHTETAYQALTQAGFQVELTEAPGRAIWEKVAVNAGINPLTALLGVPNGRLLEIPESRQLMRDLVVEAAKVAATEGYTFPYSLVEKAEEVCAQTATNISSTLQDIRNGKPTEIDAISGEIMNRAQVAGLPTPRTRVVWQLVKALEQITSSAGL